MVALPNTTPVIDDVSVVEFMHRRANDVGAVKIRCYGSVTRGTKGEQLTEMGLLADAGAVAFTDGTRAVADTMVMRRALSYARGFDLMVAQHPEDPKLANGGVMNEGEIASRLGLPGIPGAAEVIMVERDLRLAELTGGRITPRIVWTTPSKRSAAPRRRAWTSLATPPRTTSLSTKHPSATTGPS